MTLALCEKREGRCYWSRDLIIDGVAGLSNFLEFMATFEEEVEDASCDVDAYHSLQFNYW
ncbi:hypothetical protein RhiirA4_475402 [Rhizophagus irregularis]|uniref:Uncharacterized protein n=1 Tax=Rhizophagus irregularis TaxID=588596 RepID=A0A2I1HA48_9GLOM|nr:hypothetical protein RhiirA4_468537 [Rhizophagus irregularis]PKY55737.1 hypothetical protein RhiirA4_475402 [Rhizophagus irregularis]